MQHHDIAIAGMGGVFNGAAAPPEWETCCSGQLMTAGSSANLNYKSVTHIGASRVRRLDRYSRLGLMAMALCLRDAGRLVESAVPPAYGTSPVTGVVIASRFGCLATDIDYFNILKGADIPAAPNLFAYTLPNSFLGEAAIIFGLEGPALVLSYPEIKGVSVLETACQWLHARQTEALLCGWCDLMPDLLANPENGVTMEAFFFYLTAAHPKPPKTYTTLSRGAAGNILQANQQPLTNFNSLLQVCLASQSDAHAAS